MKQEIDNILSEIENKFYAKADCGGIIGVRNTETFISLKNLLLKLRNKIKTKKKTTCPGERLVIPMDFNTKCRPSRWDILKELLHRENTKVCPYPYKVKEVTEVSLFLFMNQADKVYDNYDSCFSLKDNINAQLGR